MGEFLYDPGDVVLSSDFSTQYSTRLYIIMSCTLTIAISQ